MTPLGRLHVLTDARAGRVPLEVVRAAVSAGAPVVQVRAKGGTDRELYAFATEVARLCAQHGSTCLVNDRPDVALAVGAAGVHLGEHDLPVDVVRRLIGPDAHVGGTAREPGAARALVEQGASYLGVGPAYGTTTKDGLPEPLGAAGIRAVAEAVAVPVLAIGGVTVETVPELLAAGAHGVAVVAAVSDAADPAEATRRLLAALG
ncbi:MAG: thiamine phosphate synthase [Actinobacteria bacterium]|nr:thiamine phosphate synthase [Actinomycetota bacterium]MCA1719857.1 thiamine phosphate synthase [Actinomycetota bacterium]